MKRTEWYKDCVFYQIWPRSFKDGNGDGLGDLEGVYEKLDYIKSLGCGGIWFSPVYPSPGADCGYDVSDYMSVADEFGGMDAFKKVLDGAHERGMKVIMDLVINHTSDEHEWFQKSRRRIDPYTDYYIWRKEKPNGKLPNNWDSQFEGKAWQYDEVRGEYYLHLFAVKQPDLNMDNPLVREEVVKIMHYWLDMGVDGFREDVITFISKPEDLPDDKLLPLFRGVFAYNHGPNIRRYLEQFRDEGWSDYDCVIIAEAPLTGPKKALEYLSDSKDKKRVFDMVIQLDCMTADCFYSDYLPLPFSLKKLKKAFTSWQTKLDRKGWNMLFLENHDHPRIISRYGSEKYREESGKMLCAAYMFQKGTPFVYQGQELGMVNMHFDGFDKFADVQAINAAPFLPESLRLKLLNRASRDSARTPVQWTSGENAGFSTAKPWFAVNGNYRYINAEHEETDPDSVLNFYRKAIKLRNELPAVKSGHYKECSAGSKNIYAYTMSSLHQKLLVVCSFTEKSVHFEPPAGYELYKGRLLLDNYHVHQTGGTGFDTLPYETRVYVYE